MMPLIQRKNKTNWPNVYMQKQLPIAPGFLYRTIVQYTIYELQQMAS
jgi:hypothetical protein